MAIPEQVRKQSEAINRIYEEMNAEAPAAEAVSETSESSVDAANEADSVSEAAPESVSNEQRQSDTTSETAEQRYRTLQGMYNADTARLRAENQQLNSRLSQLEQLLSSLSAQPAAQQQAMSQAEKLITDKDIEEYGESIDVMRRVSREEAAAAQRRVAELEQLVRSMQTSLLPRVEQVAQRQAVTAEQSFWSDLTSTVPNWRDVNSDPGFHSWLLEVDPLTGVTRQTYLDNAQQNLDAPRVASFFRTWQEINGQSVAQSPRNAAASQLEKQVAPGRGRSSGAPTPEQPKTYTNADIAKFFDDVRKGVFKGREAERDRIERDIFAAQRENRIVVNA